MIIYEHQFFQFIKGAELITNSYLIKLNIFSIERKFDKWEILVNSETDYNHVWLESDFNNGIYVLLVGRSLNELELHSNRLDKVNFAVREDGLVIWLSQ